MTDRVPTRDKLIEAIINFFEAVTYLIQPVVAGSDETSFGKYVEKTQKRVPEAVDVEEENGLVMVSEMPPSDNFHELVKRAEAAWQHNKGVCPFGKLHFSLMHGFDDVQFGDTIMCDLLFFKKARDDPPDGSAVLHDGICYAAHQPDIAAPEYQCDAAFRQPFAKFFGSIGIYFWGFAACGTCELCLDGKENLCKDFRATGRDAHGGYAEYMVVPAGYAYPLPEKFSDAEAAPLLCAGAVGYRSLKLLNLRNGQPAGLTGFGASAHLVLKMMRFLYPDSPVHVFARNPAEREFALSLGAVWAGDTTDSAPEPLAGIIDTTPVWLPVLSALENLRPSGRLVINAIRKESSDTAVLTQLDYAKHLWMEKEIKSVANVTAADVREFLGIAEKMALKPEVQIYPFEEANKALMDIKQRKIRGAKVLQVSR